MQAPYSVLRTLAVVGAVCAFSLVATPAVAASPTVVGASAPSPAQSEADGFQAPEFVGVPPQGYTKVPYEYQVNFTGRAPAIVGEHLPPGLTLDKSGRLYGVPTQPGTHMFRLMALDLKKGVYVEDTMVIEVDSHVVADVQLPSVGWDTPYSYQLDLAGPGTKDVRVVSGSLPPGLTLSPSGLLSGTASTRWAAPSYTFVLQATNDDGSADVPVEFTIHLAPDLVPGIAGAPPAVVSAQYSHAFQLAGPGTTVRLVSGSLPPGLTLSPAGVVSGTFTDSRPPSHTFELVAENAHLTSEPQSFTIAPASKWGPNHDGWNITIDNQTTSDLEWWWLSSTNIFQTPGTIHDGTTTTDTRGTQSWFGGPANLTLNYGLGELLDGTFNLKKGEVRLKITSWEDGRVEATCTTFQTTCTVEQAVSWLPIKIVIRVN